jgi:hypothetical protein
MELSPTATAVPITVAATAEIMATVRVVSRALRIPGLAKSSAYQRSVNPPQFALERDALKEYAISTAMGA